jgi:hypothetical protein
VTDSWIYGVVFAIALVAVFVATLLDACQPMGPAIPIR